MAVDVMTRIIRITTENCVVDVHYALNRRFRAGAYKIEARAAGGDSYHALMRVMGVYMPKAKWSGRGRWVHTQGKMAFISGDESGSSCVHWTADYSRAIDIAGDLAWAAAS